MFIWTASGNQTARYLSITWHIRHSEVAWFIEDHFFHIFFGKVIYEKVLGFLQGLFKVSYIWTRCQLEIAVNILKAQRRNQEGMQPPVVYLFWMQEIMKSRRNHRQPLCVDICCSSLMSADWAHDNETALYVCFTIVFICLWDEHLNIDPLFIFSFSSSSTD
jgi:hypothetical protein